MKTENAASIQFNIQLGDSLTWNVKPLLHEVKHALHALISNKQTAIIDLRSIPLAPGEEDRILNMLGRGEVQCQLNALGPSEIIETEYAGVWVVTHFNDDGAIIGRYIEVTDMPDILRSQAADVMTAYKRLTDDLLEQQPEDNCLQDNRATNNKSVVEKLS